MLKKTAASRYETPLFLPRGAGTAAFCGKKQLYEKQDCSVAVLFFVLTTNSCCIKMKNDQQSPEQTDHNFYF